MINPLRKTNLVTYIPMQIGADASLMYDYGAIAAAASAHGATRADGVIGKCLNYNGTQYGITTATASKLATNSIFTISMWFTYYTPVQTSGGTMLTGTGNDTPLLAIGTDGILYLVHSARAGVVGTVAPLDINRWYHAAATFEGNGSTAKIYINGVLNNSAVYTTAAPWASVAAWYIGRHNANYAANTFHKGNLSHIMVWDVALTAKEIAVLYHSTKGAFLL